MDSTHSGDLVQRKILHQLLQRENLLFALGSPTQKGYKVQKGTGQNSSILCSQAAHTTIPPSATGKGHIQLVHWHLTKNASTDALLSRLDNFPWPSLRQGDAMAGG